MTAKHVLHRRPGTGATDLELAHAGDQAAIQRCVQKLGPIVWNLVRAWVDDRQTASALVERAFWQLWRSGGDYEPERESEMVFAARIVRRLLAESGHRRSTAVAIGAMVSHRSAGPARAAATADRPRQLRQRSTSVQEQLLSATLLGGPSARLASVGAASAPTRGRGVVRDTLQSTRGLIAAAGARCAIEVRCSRREGVLA
ncbi:hypothetical protein [Engelhardtia mirabilis]|uniref:hypothetical protein n=1 Tax=Engelhardtia mirabilis TaxID=2528011 RepID=UPI003AF33F75